MAQLATLKKRIGQRILVGFDGARIPTEIARLDEEWGIGGYILKQRNLPDVKHILDLNEDLWTLGQGIPPFIGIEEEGSPIHPLPEAFTQFPDMQHLGKTNVSVAYEVGAVIGRELSAAGFNLDFAPVLDVNSQPDGSLIGGRAISEDPDKVATLGLPIIRGLHDNAIAACAKHFPGIGALREGSQKSLPVCNTDAEKLRQHDIKPFQKLVQQSSLGLDMLLCAHVLYPAIDPQLPASLSRNFTQDILRFELGFKGLIVADDLDSKVLLEKFSIEEATLRALEAGVDLFIVSDSLDHQVQVLETLLHQAESEAYPKHVWEQSFNRIHGVKARHFRVIRTIDKAHAREMIGSREHQRISRRLRDGK